MSRFRILVPVAALLFAVAGSLFAQVTGDLSYEMAAGEWIVLHVWLPSDAIATSLPAPLKPGRFTIDPLEDSPPGTMADAYIVIRHGTFRLPLAGKTVDETDVLDLMVLVTVQSPPPLRQDGVVDFYLLDYATSNQLLTTLLRNAGIEVGAFDGTYDDRTMPSMQQEAHAAMTQAGHDAWDIIARSTGSTHFDLGTRTWRIFFSDAQRALTISLRNDFYMRATSRINGFHENTPLDRFGEWRWADRDTMLLFTSGSDHVISAVMLPTQK